MDTPHSGDEAVDDRCEDTGGCQPGSRLEPVQDAGVLGHECPMGAFGSHHKHRGMPCTYMAHPEDIFRETVAYDPDGA